MAKYIKVPFPPSYFAVSTDYLLENLSLASYDNQMIKTALGGVGSEKDTIRTSWVVNGLPIRFGLDEQNNVIVIVPADTTLESLNLTQEQARSLVAYSNTVVNGENNLKDLQSGVFGYSYFAARNMFDGGDFILTATKRGGIENIVSSTNGKLVVSHEHEFQTFIDNKTGGLSEHAEPVIRINDIYTVEQTEGKTTLNINDKDFYLEVEEDFYNEVMNRLLDRLNNPAELEKKHFFSMTPFLINEDFAKIYFKNLATRSEKEQEMALKSLFSYFQEDAEKYYRKFNNELVAINDQHKLVKKNSHGLDDAAQRFLDRAVIETKRDLKTARIFENPEDLQKLIGQIQQDAARIKTPQKSIAFIENTLAPLTAYSKALRSYAESKPIDGSVADDQIIEFKRAHAQTVTDNYALAKLLINKHPISASVKDIKEATTRLQILENYTSAPNHPVFFTEAVTELEKLDHMKRSVVKNCLKGGLLILLGVGLGVLAAGLVAGGLATGFGVPAAVLGGVLGFTALSLLLKGVAVAAAKPTLKESTAKTLQNNLRLFTAKNTTAKPDRADTPGPSPEPESPDSATKSKPRRSST